MEMILPREWTQIATDEIDASSNGKTLILGPNRKTTLKIHSDVTVNILEVIEAGSANDTTLEMMPNSHVQHVRLQVETAEATSRLSATQDESSELKVFTICAGSKKAMFRTEVLQIGSGADTRIEGLYFSQAGEFVENNVRMVHAVPNGRSQQLFKGILTEKAKARFCGQIRIEENAQKVDSKQKSAALILGRQAEVQTEPILEILADDVKASHGATVGQMNSEEIFYLETRGLSRATAVQLLAKGFMDEILYHIDSMTLREYIMGRFAQTLVTRLK